MDYSTVHRLHIIGQISQVLIEKASFNCVCSQPFPEMKSVHEECIHSNILGTINRGKAD